MPFSGEGAQPASAITSGRPANARLLKVRFMKSVR